MNAALDELDGRLRLAVEQWRAAPIPEPAREAVLERLRARGPARGGKAGRGWRLFRLAVAAALGMGVIGPARWWRA